MRIALASVLAAALSLGAGTASAQPERDEALAPEELAAAEREFARGNYAVALQGFQLSYLLLEGQPTRAFILYRIGRSLEELGRHEDAADAYRRYLADAAADAAPREEAEARLRDMERRPTEPTGEGISPVGPAMLGVGGAMLLIGTVTGVAALISRADFVGMCTDLRCPTSARDLGNEVENLALATDVLLFGGAAVVAVGLALTLVLTDGGSSRDPLASFGCTDTGCMAFLAGEIP